jgi:hypothetical protein
MNEQRIMQLQRIQITELNNLLSELLSAFAELERNAGPLIDTQRYKDARDNALGYLEEQVLGG